MDSHGCLGSVFCIVRQNKWTDMAAWVLSSALSVRTNGPTWLLTCLLFSTRGSGGHNRPTLRHTSLSGTVASLPHCAPRAPEPVRMSAVRGGVEGQGAVEPSQTTKLQLAELQTVGGGVRRLTSVALGVGAAARGVGAGGGARG